MIFPIQWGHVCGLCSLSNLKTLSFRYLYIILWEMQSLFCRQGWGHCKMLASYHDSRMAHHIHGSQISCTIIDRCKSTNQKVVWWLHQSIVICLFLMREVRCVVLVDLDVSSNNLLLWPVKCRHQVRFCHWKWLCRRVFPYIIWST